MNEYLLNRPSCGAAMTAEEYAASVGSAPGGGTVCCCCSPAPPPCPPPVTEEGCCCKEAFRGALQLLCRPEISELLNFDAAAFLTDSYAAGAVLTAAVAAAGPADNLSAAPTGTFRRFSPCSLDLLEITASLNTLTGTATGLTAAEVNLCELTAVIIQLAAAEAEGDLTPEQVALRNLRRVSRSLSRQLTPCSSGCGGTACACPVSEDCCCAAGILSALAENNISRRVSLAAGPLLLGGVTLLGHVGNVLVLVNETDLRFYFVCVNHIQFIA